MPVWAWVLLLLGGVMLIACGGGIAALFYFSAHAPDTKVYAGNEVPAEYIDIATGLGLIEPGEQVRYFYSDAVLSDVREKFYFVSDRKVAVYVRSAARPAVAVPFDRIKDVAFSGSDSEWIDGSITLTLKDGSTVGFPVSAELGRDKLFYQAIRDSMPKTDGNGTVGKGMDPKGPEPKREGVEE